MADLTPEKEQEFKFRLRLEQEQAQEKAAQAEIESQEGYINPLTPTIVGAAAGPVVGPSISAGAREVQRTNIARQMGVNPADLEWDSAGQKWARKTGFGAGEGKTVQEVNEEFKRIQAEKNKPVGRGKIVSKMTGPYNVEKAAELADAETARQARFAAQRQAEAAAMKKYAPLAERMNLPRGMQTAGKALGAGLSGGIPAILGRGIAGGTTAYQGVDAYNRLKSGDVGGGLISGVGALGSAASFLPHPILRYGGMGVAGGAELLNQYLDGLKQKREGYAEGGSAKKKMSKAERAAKAIQENNKKKVPHLSNGGLPPAENAARTQIIGTLPTYEKAEEELKKRGAQGRALDFGAGLGEGAKILKADTFEPFPKGWKPTFIDPKQIPTEAYGKLTNLNVMNVVPPKVRDEIASHIGRVIEPGGQGIVTTRGADVMKAKGRPGPEPMSIITSRDTYQKGFTKQELEDYMKRMLGEKYDVNKVNLGPAGVHVQKKKPTIYTGGGLSIPVNAPVGSRAQETTGQGAAQILNPLNLNFKEGGQVKHYLTGGSVLGAPADFVPGNGPPPGMTWSETQGQWMPSGSVVGAMPGPGMDPINNFDTSGNPTQNASLPSSGSFTPLPTFAPGMDPINNFDRSGNLTQNPATPNVGSGLTNLTAPKPVAPITPQQPFQQRRVAPPLSGNINPSFAKRALPYTPKPIPKPMPRRRMFAEGGSTTPAWQRSEGKSPSGGLNALGRASYKRETGGELKAPQPEGGSRKKSFCARMGGMKKKLTSSKTANDPDSRINKALRKWKC
jgi:hypothetical protein